MLKQVQHDGSKRHMITDRRDNSRHIRARRGSEIKAKHWTTEAAVRMLMNNLDEEVAEDPQSLVVYGGIGRAARNWAAYDTIVETLERLEEDQTLLIQSGKPVEIGRASCRERGGDSVSGGASN